MNIAKIALVAAITVALNAAASSEEQQTDDKIYVCGSEKMKLKELEDGRLARISQTRNCIGAENLE